MKKKKDPGSPEVKTMQVKPLKERIGVFYLKGTSILMMHAFAQKIGEQMRARQAEGSQAKSKNKREPKDFDALYRGSQHRSTEGWIGVPATAFRNSMIRACKAAGFVMTDAKNSIFIEADGVEDNGNPLIRINGKPTRDERWARNDNGSPDIRVRTRFDRWSLTLRVRYDEDQFSAESIMSILHRAGAQVGILDGRPSSPRSNGQGWGLWKLVTKQEL